ncbi:MAG: SMP-30/gluconolactonase/LRE family protein [Rhodoferax sp.]|nr:SMP-30/gluconolactonase/LRE family protein [Rhodoferax sp.]MBP7493667.1 SMP-30/gluconolactonase/LRE family protein [Rhodoferax sp.]
MNDVQRAWPQPLNLGEGPMWHEPSQQFYCVDIHGCAIHAWSPSSGAHRSWAMPERIGWLIARNDGDGFMAGLQSGFARVWLEPELRIEAAGCAHLGQPDVRLNDAKADLWGRIWAGAMNNRDPSQADGYLARLDPSGQFTVVEAGIHIANGPVIAPDGLWMLHSDSFLNTTYRYRITVEGQLLDKSVWRAFTEAEGTPDGMTMDRDGNIWIAFWGGGCVRQFDPQGVQLRQIDLPATQITSMAFGGDQLDWLLVTSASAGLSAEQLAQFPQAGCTFVLRPGVTGLLPLGFA